MIWFGIVLLFAITVITLCEYGLFLGGETQTMVLAVPVQLLLFGIAMWHLTRRSN